MFSYPWDKPGRFLDEGYLSEGIQMLGCSLFFRKVPCQGRARACPAAGQARVLQIFSSSLDCPVCLDLAYLVGLWIIPTSMDLPPNTTKLTKLFYGSLRLLASFWFMDHTSRAPGHPSSPTSSASHGYTGSCFIQRSGPLPGCLAS